MIAALALAVAAAALLAPAAWLLRRPTTPPFRDAPAGLAAIERWRLNGSLQTVVIRGRDLANPVLVWAGDFAGETPLLRRFNGDLEDVFTVVYWAQRFSGQTFDPFAPRPVSLTLSAFVDDLEALVETARDRFGHGRVVLVGHSSGTAVGLAYAQRRPERLVAYVGVGQIVNPAESLRRAYAFAVATAAARGRRRAAVQLGRIGPPPHRPPEAAILRRWVIAFGGAFHADLSYARLAWLALTAPEANWRDLAAFAFADAYTAPLAAEMAALAFDAGEPRCGAPVFLALGRHDRRTDSALAAAFLERLQAPAKGHAWFEHSAHSPPFEEPEEFSAWLRREVLPLALEARTERLSP